MSNGHNHDMTSRLIFGILIVAAGVFLLVDNLWVEMDYNLGDFWPVILIAIGLSLGLKPAPFRRPVAAALFLIVGGLFLANNLGYIDFWFRDLWPILLILVGFEVLRGGWKRKHGLRAHSIDCCGPNDETTREERCFLTEENHTLDEETINLSVLLGGGEYAYTSKKMKGGKISAVLGGCKVNLRDAEIAGNNMTIDAHTVMGGVEIFTPTHWEVVLNGSPIMGAIENKTRPADTTKKLYITGSAVMGAVEVYN